VALAGNCAAVNDKERGKKRLNKHKERRIRRIEVEAGQIDKIPVDRTMMETLLILDPPMQG
jgi:hypothetical protein